MTASLLMLVVLMTSFAADKWITNAQLSLPLLIAAVCATATAAVGIPLLRRLKMGQFIREEGPKTHQSKAGTPTMGGLLVVPVGVVLGSLITRDAVASQQLLSLAVLTLAFMLIGGIDDWSSLTKHTNTGLTARGKLLLQAMATAAFLAIAAWQGWISSSIALPFGLELPLGLMIWPLGLFVVLAESNATNLTDGLDGLASGCGALVFTGLALQLMLRGDNGDPALAGFCMAMAGAWLGFLVHNRNPARAFMGDTGSLAMGAALSGVALLSNSLWPLLVMGGVFVAESLSVIIQVWVFKATKGPDGQGRRVFRMAPLHHHFELGGTDEQSVVPAFWLVTAGLVLLGLVLRP
ncbi:phospho-N-acetylmuramoyl-pentapeptide-transferase [Synechococcus sp. CC9605]|uniref:Phospho-N-acetylmuramoyl-pentapeptide-transferase n=1 Tax=Synechococcus sp. (strain CC9605) TaxID=110662 RepID=MRAY_SYNSC|nr:RecName: Full=Phospho-N-acetylmuramoyl-pentapeptide-transferase; AltName: Full=UDP-MurNAc-pentapeptide phosphotransferase [Synechococcus sp. CC9605]ABB36407.1 phospho-N-acetylmuramoyl-pentapeptide-transferase [Synechococcus sp. CC9605]